MRVRRCVLFVVLAISFSFGESKTPFQQRGYLGRQTQIDDLSIEGCDEEFCELREEKSYRFNVTFTTPAAAAAGRVKMIYELQDDEGICNSVDMPEFCDSLVGGHQCPLKVDESATYAAALDLSAPLKIWGLTETRRKLILKIMAYTVSESRAILPFVHVDVNITLKRCWPLCF